jgi:hypothetical protein
LVGQTYNDPLIRRTYLAGKKLRFLKIVNLTIAVLFLVQFTTVIPIFFNFGNFEVILGIHRWVGLSFLIIIPLHIFLNWNWIRANFFSRSGKSK